ncbi:MAG: CotH kinase family protein [Muribaculaceae bacterium]|nr:CotH kinase family protein [Muribaculaceae bacterium]
MQSNIDCVFVDNEFPDSWLELYNTSSSPINIRGFKIGDSNDPSNAFTLPNRIIDAHSHLLIYCDKVGSGIHCDFRIDSGKGELYLFNSDNSIADHITYKKMPAPNVAYGRESDNSNTWGYMLTPSPGNSNSGGITTIVLPEPKFSISGRIINKRESLTITIPDENLPKDTKIYYTLDGQEPTTESQSTDKLTLTIYNTTIVRAKLISSSAISPRSTTHSYIFHPRTTQLPIVSLTTNIDYFYDSEIGIFYGTEGQNPNYEHDWRRPIHVEYFVKGEDDAVINQLCETRTQGGWTRNLKQKSIALYANKRFGTKRFSYTLWKDKPNVEESKSFILRNSGNDCYDAHIRDAFVQTLFGRHLNNVDWQAYQPCVYYINGKYMGIYDVRERSNEDYVEANYDGLEDIDMIENWKEIKAGTMTNFRIFRNQYQNSNVSYETLNSLLDVDNFLKMFIANTWVTNTDFPGNNIVMWRPTETGGKWRWVLKDMDFLAYNPSDYNYFDFILRTGPNSNDTGYANSTSATALFRAMMSKDEFKNLFIDHFAVYLGDFLQSSVTSSLLKELTDEIAKEYPHHLDYWQFNSWTDLSHWENCVSGLVSWTKERTDNCYNILKNYFELGNLVNITISHGDAPVTFNNIPLTQENFIGKYFSNRNIILDTPGHESVWEITTIFNSGRQAKRTVSDLPITITPTPGISSIHCELLKSSGITTTKYDDSTFEIIRNENELTFQSQSAINHIEVYNIAGQLVLTQQPLSPSFSIVLPSDGIYILKATNHDGKHITKKIIL